MASSWYLTAALVAAQPIAENSLTGTSEATRHEQKLMSNSARRERIKFESYEDALEIIVTAAALRCLEALAPGDEDAKKAILIAVQNLYWTTDIPATEIRDAYAPGLRVNAVPTIAGPAKLKIVCHRCGGSLYVASRTSSLREICSDCQDRETAAKWARPIDFCVTDLGEHEPREGQQPVTAAVAYSDYLQTADWKIRREGALKRAGFSCQVCSGKGELHVHHRTYVRRGNEAAGDLIVLCASCHKLFHENGRLAQGGRANA